MANRPQNINSHGCKRMSGETVLDKMIKKKNKKPRGSRTIRTLHEKWAVKNGYRNNEKLNSQNTVSFKDGT